MAAKVSACTKRILHKSRVKAVPGEGPGFHENQQGRPFVGPAGQLLEELLASLKLKREQAFIGNVVKCRPRGNRDPLPEEIEACKPYLDRQIALLRPRVIVTLGRYSMARVFPNEKISRIHGQAKKVDGIVYVPMYHPAAALHQPSLRRDVEEDFKKLPAILAEIEQMQDEEPPAAVEQLSLF